MNTRILIPLDGSETAECVLPYVKWFTDVSKVSEIVFVRVVEPLHLPGGIESRFGPEERAHIEQDSFNLAGDNLKKVAGQFSAAGAKLTPVVLKGNPAETIASYAEPGSLVPGILHEEVHVAVAEAVEAAARRGEGAGVPQ